MNAVARPSIAARRESDELVRRHADLVKRIAYHLCARLPSSVEVDDLIQAGMLGVLEAAAHYAEGKGASFETFAGIRIRGAMIDALRKLDWAPRSVHRRSREVAQAIRDIERDTGGEARAGDIAARLGIGLDDYHRIVQDSVGCQLASLEELGTIEPGDDRPDPFREVADLGFRAALARAIDGLPERERLMMALYYQEEMNLKEIGLVMGVTESRVSQVHGQAIARLKARLADWRDGDGGAIGAAASAPIRRA
jgi:RNA polymerase sigma factor for flagellar operon FliA